MTKMIKGIDKAVNGFLTWVVVLMLAVMSVVVFGQVLWTTFLGSALCVRKGSLVGLEILFMMLPKKAVKAVMLLVQAATAAFMVFLIVMGYKTAGLVWNQTTPVLKMPMGLMYASIPTGAVFMLINTIIVVYYQITGEDVK